MILATIFVCYSQLAVSQGTDVTIQFLLKRWPTPLQLLALSYHTGHHFFPFVLGEFHFPKQSYYMASFYHFILWWYLIEYMGNPSQIISKFCTGDWTLALWIPEGPHIVMHYVVTSWTTVLLEWSMSLTFHTNEPGLPWDLRKSEDMCIGCAGLVWFSGLMSQLKSQMIISSHVWFLILSHIVAGRILQQSPRLLSCRFPHPIILLPGLSAKSVNGMGQILPWLGNIIWQMMEKSLLWLC